MALMKYPACKLSAVRFLSETQPSDECHFVTGTWEQPVNRLHLWSASRESGVQLLHQQEHETGDVCAIQPLMSQMVATASSTGSVAVYHADGPELKQVCERRAGSGVLTALAYWDACHSLISAGEDGAVTLVSMDKLSGPLTRHQVSQAPITSLHALPGSPVLCGTTAGSIKSMDSRSLTVTASLSSSVCAVTAVRRNPSNSHLVVSITYFVPDDRSLTSVLLQASGTQSGHLCLWDMRKTDTALLQLASHSACITELQYKENESNVIISSSLDGKLIRWNLLPTSEVTAAEAVVSPQSLSGPAIICFHLHPRTNDLVFATDRETLSHISL